MSKNKSKSGIRNFGKRGKQKAVSNTTDKPLVHWEGGFIKVDTGESAQEKVARLARSAKRKLTKRVKYLAVNPNRPHVTARDGRLDDAKVLTKTIVPPAMQGKISDEEYIEMTANDLDSCEMIYHDLLKQLEHPIKQIEERMLKEGEKFLPYIVEGEKFKDVVKMTYNDIESLKRELDSIRALYAKHIDENGRVKDSANRLRGTAYMIELVLDIKLRYTVVANRIQKVVGMHLPYLSDFYSQAVVMYYMDHMDEAPDDVKKLIEEDLPRYMPKMGNPQEGQTSEVTTPAEPVNEEKAGE